jgi:GTPase
MFEFIDKQIPKQKREMHNGNREYKIYLDIDQENDNKVRKNKNKNKTKEFMDELRKIKLIGKVNKRASQLKYRLEEGYGKALYMIGVKDNGDVEGINIETLFKSLNFLYKMIDIINANIKNIRIYKGAENGKYICTARIEIPNYLPKQLPVIDIL